MAYDETLLIRFKFFITDESRGNQFMFIKRLYRVFLTLLFCGFALLAAGANAHATPCSTVTLQLQDKDNSNGNVGDPNGDPDIRAGMGSHYRLHATVQPSGCA